jgi:hypothetical protein
VTRELSAVVSQLRRSIRSEQPWGAGRWRSTLVADGLAQRSIDVADRRAAVVALSAAAVLSLAAGMRRTASASGRRCGPRRTRTSSQSPTRCPRWHGSPPN